MMMFGVPIGLTALIYVAFGGVSPADTPAVAETRVLLVNQDAGLRGFSAGEILGQALSSDTLAGMISVTLAEDWSAAKGAVDRQDADVAVLMPQGLSETMALGAGDNSLVLYHDPGATIGPSLVQGVLEGVLDRLRGSEMAVALARARLAESGRTLGPEDEQALRTEFDAAVSDWLDAAYAEGEHPLVAPRDVGHSEDATDPAPTLALIAAGQLLFAAFFAAAYSNESLLREEEEGTLPRLFTTPVPREMILVGKFLSTALLVLIQSVSMMVAGRLALSIAWGSASALVLLEVGLIVAASGLGAFLLSLVDSTAQAGYVIGGALSATSLLGGLFTVAVPNMPRAVETLSLALPQGWAIRGWAIAIRGGGAGDVVGPCLVMVVYGAVLFAIGARRFRRRYA